MKAIHSTATAQEIYFRKYLYKRGIRYRKNYRGLPGVTDIAITKYKIAIFIDGEFWHGFNWETKRAKIITNREYWINKIEKNINRDKKNNEYLEGIGWKAIRFWANEVKTSTQECFQEILKESFHCLLITQC